MNALYRNQKNLKRITNSKKLCLHSSSVGVPKEQTLFTLFSSLSRGEYNNSSDDLNDTSLLPFRGAQRVLEVMHHMKQMKIIPHVQSVNAAFSHMVKYGTTEERTEFYENLKLMKVFPESQVVEKELKSTKQNSKLIEELRSNLPFERQSFNTIILRESGFKPLPLSDMKGVHSIYANEEPYNALLFALLSHSGNNTTKALQVLSGMISEQVMPSTKTFNLILAILLKSNALQETLKTFDMMKSHTVTPNITTYKLVIQGQLAAGQSQDALKAFLQASRNRIVLDRNTLEMLCIDLLRNGIIKQGLRVLANLRTNGYFLSRSSAKTMIYLLCAKESTANVIMVLKILPKYTQDGVLEDVVLRLCRELKIKQANALIQFCHKKNISSYPSTSFVFGLSQKPHTALEMINFMITNKINRTRLIQKIIGSAMDLIITANDPKLDQKSKEKNDVRLELHSMMGLMHKLHETKFCKIFHLFVRFLCKRDNAMLSFYVLQAMKKHQFATPDIDIYNSIIKHLSRHNNGILVLDALEQMQTDNIVPTTKVFNFILEYLCKNAHVKAALEVLHQMRQLEVPTDIFSYSHVIIALIQSKKLEEATELYLQLIDNTTLSHKQLKPLTQLHNTLSIALISADNPSLVAKGKTIEAKGLHNKS